MSAQVFGFQQILSVFSSSPQIYNALIDEIRKGFINYSNKVVYVAPVVHLGCTDGKRAQNMDIPPPMTGGGDVCLKSGYIVDDQYYVIKIAGGGFKDDRGASFPNSGAMLIFSQQTGALNGVLLDDGILTELRTAAASMLAIKYFAPTTIINIGIVGTGVQARYQLEMLQHVVPLNALHLSVYVYGRRESRCQQYRREMAAKGIRCAIKITNDLADIARNCNVIIMCTSSRAPLLRKEHLMHAHTSHGLLVNCIGADSAGKQELQESIVSDCADLIVVDSLSQCREFGEIQHAVKHGTLRMEKVMEMGRALSEECVASVRRNKEQDKRVILFDSTGVAVQDVVITKMVYQTLCARKKDSKL